MTPYDSAVRADCFATSRGFFDLLLTELADPVTGELSHAELEVLCEGRGRRLVRQLLQDHLDLRAEREEAHLATEHPPGRLE